MVSGKSSYYDSSEIEDAVFDLLDEAKTDEACELAETGVKLHPGDETLEKLLCWIYLHTQQVDKAEQIFARYEHDGTESTVKLKFCFEVINGHPQSALSNFFQYLESKGIKSLDWVTTIDEMFDAIPHEVLIPHLEKAANLIQDNAEALGRVGAMLMDCKQFLPAVHVLEKSLDMDAYDIFSWQDLSRCYFELNDLEKCAESCDYGLAIDPENPMLNFTRGYLHYNNNEWADAVRTMEVARRFAEGRLHNDNINLTEDEIQANTTITYHILGTSYAALGKVDEAIECFEILMERNPNNEEFLMELSTLLLDEGDLPKTLALAERGLQHSPKNTNILALKASVLTSMQRYTEALEILQQLHKIKPKSKNYLLAIAELANAIHRYETADNAFRSLLELRPKDKNTRDRLWEYFASIGDDDALRRVEGLNGNRDA